MYIFRIARARLDLFTKASYVDVHGPDITGLQCLIAPNKGQQALSGVDLIRIAYQQFKKVELFCRQVDLLLSDKDPAALPVKL